MPTLFTHASQSDAQPKRGFSFRGFLHWPSYLFPFSCCVFLVHLVGCSPEAKVEPTANVEQSPSSQPAAASQPAKESTGGQMAGYFDGLTDPEYLPKRLGITRYYLAQDKVTAVRDIAAVPKTEDIIAVARVAGRWGVWRMSTSGAKPAEPFFQPPLFDKTKKADVFNRKKWHIGSPRFFPDGKTVLFAAASISPRAAHSDKIMIYNSSTGQLSAIRIKGQTGVRTPDVMSDGKTILFATCTSLRTFQLNVSELKPGEVLDVESAHITTFDAVPNKKRAVCTIHRPRFSPSGNKITVEVIGNFLSDELLKKHKVPAAKNAGDYLLEPWILNSDGTGMRRLFSDSAYVNVGGRLQSGGTRDPSFSPDGSKIVVSHGSSIVVVDATGQEAVTVAQPFIKTSAIRFRESDPTYTSSGRKIVMSSSVTTEDSNIPPAIAVVDLEALSLSAIDEEKE